MSSKHLEAAAEQLTLRRDVIHIVDGIGQKKEEQGTSEGQIARAVNATVIPLEQAPEGYKELDEGAAKKFVLNPHGLITA